MKYLKKIFESNSGKTWSQTPTHEEQLEMVENIFIDDIDAEKCDVDIDEKDHIRVYLFSLIDEEYDDSKDLISMADVDRLIANSELEVKAYKKLKMYLARLEYMGFIYEINADGLQEVIIKIPFLESEEPNIFEYLWRDGRFRSYNKSKLKQIFKKDYDINITQSSHYEFKAEFINAYADRVLDDELKERIKSDSKKPSHVSFDDDYGVTIIQIKKAYS